MTTQLGKVVIIILFLIIQVPSISGEEIINLDNLTYRISYQPSFIIEYDLTKFQVQEVKTRAYIINKEDPCEIEYGEEYLTTLHGIESIEGNYVQKYVLEVNADFILNLTIFPFPLVQDYAKKIPSEDGYFRNLDGKFPYLCYKLVLTLQIENNTDRLISIILEVFEQDPYNVDKLYTLYSTYRFTVAFMIILLLLFGMKKFIDRKKPNTS